MSKIESFAEARIRHGKTKKDHESGAHQRTRANQVARHEWNNEFRGDKNEARAVAAFPAHTLGGKGNSSLPFKVCGGRGRTQDHRLGL